MHLKIKIKSLAAEANIIRFEAKKVNGEERCILNEHRKNQVRKEARHSMLAYGLLRGVPYSKMESKCNEAPDLKKINKMVLRFRILKDNRLERVRDDEWFLEAQEHIRAQKHWCATIVEKRQATMTVRY
jgi:hypothetical protein